MNISNPFIKCDNLQEIARKILRNEVNKNTEILHWMEGIEIEVCSDTKIPINYIEESQDLLESIPNEYGNSYEIQSPNFKILAFPDVKKYIMLTNK